MRPIAVEFIRPATLALVDFLRAVATFTVCRERHVWPPLPIVNALLEQGRAAAPNGELLCWTPFELSHSDYARAVAFLDPDYRVDGLGIDRDDCALWFERAALLPPPASGDA
jgi:hypothetical protein